MQHGAKFNTVPWYQVPRDLTEPTLSGAIVSCCTAPQPCLRELGLEFNNSRLNGEYI